MAIPAISRICLAAALFVVGALQAVAQTPDAVSLRESTITWSTVKFATDADNGFVDGSLDTSSIVDRTFRTWVLENRYLKVTLLPEFGGRILSIVYKPTGHEQLYRTEVGVPYGMKAGNFYYDWLMVYGGIFPTFPDPEHGRTWLKPWHFAVVSQSSGEVTVAMSIDVTFAYAAAPPRFKGAAGIKAAYFVTLKAGRAALDTRVVLRNPTDAAIPFEYWTCTTLAPGSDPKRPRATAGAEIIAPIQAYTTPTWSNNLSAGDENLGEGRHRFDRVRYFRNWPEAAIAYAAPDMQGGNFWGVINHDSEEGVIRIADNRVTRGLKMWTWGFQSFANETDPRKDPNPQRPYVELWAGISDQFFHYATFPARSEISVAETWSPTVGMSNVTHANEKIVVNLSAEASTVSLQFVSVEPGVPLRVTLKRGGDVLFDAAVTADAANGNRIAAPLPAGSNGGQVELAITDAAGRTLIAAETAIK